MNALKFFYVFSAVVFMNSNFAYLHAIDFYTPEMSDSDSNESKGEHLGCQSNQKVVETSVTDNERALSDAVMLTVIQLSDRAAVYAKQAILLEREMMMTTDIDKKACVRDTVNFFKTLTIAQTESEIRLAHGMFADRYIQCQRIMITKKDQAVIL